MVNPDSVNPQASFGAALERLMKALALAPGDATLWAQFSDLIRYFNLRHPVPPPVRDLLGKALEHPAVDPGNLVRPITTLALSRPAGKAFAEPLLLRLLEDAVIRDAALERLIVETRRRMLAEVFGRSGIALEVQTVIAHQCFNTEYVFDETDEERKAVAALKDAIETADPVPEQWCVVYAAYRGLSSLGKQNLPSSSLVRRQVVEPLEELQLREKIPSMGLQQNAVSLKVREQYEANPYPRWVRTQTAGFSLPEHPVAKEPRILLAGCGTGQNAIATAQRFPGSRILALDLSLTSLGYAMRKTRELGLAGRIEYRQADLLSLGGLDERFDLVECSGVLHHLEDPLAGWRVLAGLRKPGGFMRVGLYSAAGRRDVARARELIAQRGFSADLEAIRASRAEVRKHESDPLLARIARNEDFFSVSGCRDLLFHVHEVDFSLQEIEQMVAALGLRFLGFEFPDSGATLERFKGDPASLADWQRFEQDYPDSFSRLYQFWVS